MNGEIEAEPNHFDHLRLESSQRHRLEQLEKIHPEFVWEIDRKNRAEKSKKKMKAVSSVEHGLRAT
jgi:hypothetical protein